MNCSVDLVSFTEWNELSEKAHQIVFGQIRPKELNRFHFALACTDEENNFAGYFTCLEMDSESLYIQHGGVTPRYQNTSHVLGGYGKMILWIKERYKRVSTKVENTNIKMLKLAMHIGFLVVGTSTFKDKIYLDLLMEF